MKKIIGLMVGVMLSLSVMADEWYDQTTGFTWTYSVSAGKSTITDVSLKKSTPRIGNANPGAILPWQ